MTSPTSDSDRTIFKLRQANDQLRAKNLELFSQIETLTSELKTLRGTDLIHPLMHHYRLTMSEARIVSMLLKNKNVTKEKLWMDFYSDRPDDIDPKIFDVFICKARKKIAPAKIEQMWGRGWMMTEENKELIRAKIGD